MIDTSHIHTTQTAARKLGCSPWVVRQLIASGRLPSVRLGTTYLIDDADLDLPAVRHRPTGRPRKRLGAG